jgi:hypothetical protein
MDKACYFVVSLYRTCPSLCADRTPGNAAISLSTTQIPLIIPADLS